VTGWKEEEYGVEFWPMVTTFYIIKYLMLDGGVENLDDYKESKAYSYFKQGGLERFFTIHLERVLYAL